MLFKGVVIKQVGGKFTVRTEKELFTVSARGKLKTNGVLVGDEVETDGEVIIKVFHRKNKLIRPSIANVDRIVIVISELPACDFNLVDKLIIYADKNKIETIICVNKLDISKKLYKCIKEEYGNVVYKIVGTNAIDNDVSELKPLLKDKFSVFAGQSAVGKSTLINALMKKEIAQVGSLSKIDRGKNTTRETEIYEIEGNSYIADTPGFSMLDLINFSPEELSKGYSDLYMLSSECKYRQCDHIYVSKIDCKVLREIEKKDGLKRRYERYKNLYNETKEAWRKRYG